MPFWLALTVWLLIAVAIVVLWSYKSSDFESNGIIPQIRYLLFQGAIGLFRKLMKLPVVSYVVKLPFFLFIKTIYILSRFVKESKNFLVRILNKLNGIAPEINIIKAINKLIKPIKNFLVGLVSSISIKVKNVLKKIGDKYSSPEDLKNTVFSYPLWWWQYLVLLRVPLIAGLFLILFPVLATKKYLPLDILLFLSTFGLSAIRYIFPFNFSLLFENLFIMDDIWQLGITLVGTAITSLMISVVFSVIFINAPKRYSKRLGVSINDDTINGIPSKITQVIERLKKLKTRYSLAIILSLPISITTIVLSVREIGYRKASIGSLLGILISGIIFLIVYIAANNLAEDILDHQQNFLGKRFFVNWIKLFDKEYNEGYLQTNNQNEFTYGNVFGIALSLVGIFIYIIVIGINYPEWNTLAQIPFIGEALSGFKEASSLLYLLLIVWVATAILGGATFYADYFRVPLILFFILFSGFSYWIFGIDHYFELKTTSSQYTVAELTDFTIPIEQRLKDQTSWDGKTLDGKTLVVVAASGGGIQAAGWTVEVLRGLHEELGSSFTKATGMISSASGGSVGTMFLLDRLVDVSPNNSETITEKFDRAFKNATENSLDAVGWGLAYPDLFRAIGLRPFVFDKYLDRASAMEKDWEKEMNKSRQLSEEIPTLKSWQKPIMSGNIPIPVFNATLVEDGGRILFSPMKFIKDNLSDIITGNSSNLNKQKSYDRQILDFYTLYNIPEQKFSCDSSKNEDSNTIYDLKISTAARLSATFPYVSPLARNDIDNCIKVDGKKQYYNYHIADGGYFDNAGLFTTLEWLNDWLPTFRHELNIQKVLLLQINAFPESKLKPQQGDRGWFTEFIGPLKTLNSVRNSTQIARNQEEAEFLKEIWQNKEKSVDIRPFTIFFPEGYDQPLSWKLSEEQKNNLVAAWQKIISDKNPQSSFNQIKDTWKKWEMMKIK